MKKQINKIWPVIVALPLVVGAIGYYKVGNTFSNSLYAGFTLYFTNPVSDDYNGWIEFARWTAPIVTVSAILCALKSGWNNIVWRVLAFCEKESVAVYTDMPVRIKFEKNKHAVYPGEDFKKYFDTHIIMFGTDEKNFRFYEENQKELAAKKVVIATKELESGILKDLKHEKVKLFDTNYAISKLLWKKISLWNRGGIDYDVAICGSGALARQILAQGLQLNLFSKSQSVKYHLISDNEIFKIRHPQFGTQNKDEIIYHKKDSSDAWKSIREADIVIVAEVSSSDNIQNIIVNNKKEVYYYSPSAGDIGTQLDFVCRIIPYGRNEEIFTYDNVGEEKLLQKAKAAHNSYVEGELDKLENGKQPKPINLKAWQELSYFVKSSNISKVDYDEVRDELEANGRISKIESAEFEHIRWWRFYQLNYWEYDEHRDDNNRKHDCMKPFEQLSSDAQAKDIS